MEIHILYFVLCTSLRVLLNRGKVHTVGELTDGDGTFELLAPTMLSKRMVY